MNRAAIRCSLTLVVTLALAAGPPAITQGEPAPDRILKVAVLVSNPVLVTKKPDGTLGGVSVEIGRLLATRLQARYQEVVYDTTETFAKSFGAGAWDIAIGPRTPIAERASELSRPFMLVDNIYVAAPGRNFAHADDVDRPGVRIAVVINGAPDQFLSRYLKSATLVRVPGSTPQIIEALRAGQADVYGSNAENVHAAAAAIPGSRILPGAFRTVNMVVAYPKGTSSAKRQVIDAAVSEAISSGLVQRAIEAAGSKGVRVAE